MSKYVSLDELIAKKAVEFADQIRQAAAMADKEEEIRIEVEKQLAFIQKEAGVKLEGRHEFTVASGRVDSVYQRVIIEYKNPSSPSDRIGPKPDSPGTKKVVDQIKKRFYDMRSEHGQPLNSLFGVGLDGNHFVFIRFRDDKWQVQDPVEVNKVSAERFLWALFNLGHKGKPFSPEYLAGDFGSEGGNSIAATGIHTLYEAIATAKHPKAKMFFDQWKILFGEVCGYDVDNPSDKIKKLADFYGVPLKGFKPAELLFAVHSYYAIFMKLLASEIVAFFHKLPTPLAKMMQATTSAKLKREMEELEAGSIFRHLNITNFLEGDLFAWYVSVWSDPIEKLVRAMVAKLDDYNPGTLSEDPTGSRDLLKKLYQQLFPKSVRHDLGEYYTPDWLAEHVLNELGYAGDPDKRILDPACGSGTFLVMAINRIRVWYDQNREKCSFGEDDLCRKILANVVGFDLNPLAVMAARTNYLIAIRDLIGHVDKVEIPIYLCDSILTPASYGGLFAGTTGAAKELKTAAANFLIPTEIATNRDDVAKYAEQLELCVAGGYSSKEFIERCQEEGLTVSTENLHTGLYEELVKLDKANKNGVWARIIKNSFAPLFVGDFDCVVGNPPWVNWESFPVDYRKETKTLWVRYGLFTLSGSAARLGGGKKDIAMLFVYVCVDRYLRDNGRLGFVITQTVFKTKGAADGFRRFAFAADDGKTQKFFSVVHVDEMTELHPFEFATNRTAVVVCRKGPRQQYPVKYTVWSSATDAIVEESSLSRVKAVTTREVQEARPADPGSPNSPWANAPADVFRGLQRIVGDCEYRAYAGAYTGGLNGCFWIRIIKTLSDGRLLVENLWDVGKIKVEHVETAIEADRIYPLLRGRDVGRWHSAPSCYLILAQDPETRQGVPEGILKRHCPLTYAYLKRFEVQLRSRGSSSLKRLMETGAFYSMFAIGPYTMAPFKVVFKELTNVFQTAVVSSVPSPANGLVIPDLKLRFIPCSSEPEAHYVSAILNSSPSVVLLASAASCVQTADYQASDIQRLRIPAFDIKNNTHRALADLSLTAHRLALQSVQTDLEAVEQEIDIAVADFWGIRRGELKAIQEAATRVGSPRRAGGSGMIEESADV